MISRRSAILASSCILIFVVAASLIATIRARQPPPKLIQIVTAQAANAPQVNRIDHGGGKINGSAFDRGDIILGTSTISPRPSEIIDVSHGSKPTTMNEGFIGLTPTHVSSSTSNDEGYIGPAKTSQLPVLASSPPSSPELPILAKSYDGSGGPKHCRGRLVQKLSVPRPIADWKNGTCVDLPKMARCGVFFAQKDDHCEAQLFNTQGCLNSKETYVNTVVFMPEERPIGAYWNSMFVKCGVDTPDAGMLDPSILGDLLVKPNKPG